MENTTIKEKGNFGDMLGTVLDKLAERGFYIKQTYLDETEIKAEVRLTENHECVREIRFTFQTEAHKIACLLMWLSDFLLDVIIEMENELNNVNVAIRGLINDAGENPNVQ